MSISRLAICATAFLLLASCIEAQDCGCQPRPRLPHCSAGCGPAICRPVFSFASADSGRCPSAGELWAGFAESTNCRGCVRTIPIKPYLPDFTTLPGWCGRPMGDFQAAVSNCRQNLSLPAVTAHWPRPFHLPQADCRSMQTGIQDAFTLLGLRKKKARCDFQNDYFGRLGESLQSPTPLPAVDHPVSPVKQVDPAAENHSSIAPLVDPGNDQAGKPSFDFSAHPVSQ